MGIQLSVLIVNWRSKNYVRRCVETVMLTCSDLDTQVIVVDGGSFDGCGDMLAAEFPRVEFVQSHTNLGFGRLNNLGFERVTGNTLLLLNPDCELLSGAVPCLLAELHSRPDAGILGPRLLNTDGSLQTSCVQSLPTPWNQALDSEFLRRLLPKSKLWGVGESFRANTPVPVEAVSGACMLLRADVFRRLGGFRPEFFMYAEDMDLCSRVRELGLKVYHVPRAMVVHHGGGSSRAQASEFGTIMQRVSGETYSRLNHGPATAFWYRALQAVSALVRLGLLLPVCVFFGWGHSASGRMSVRRWCSVLQWAFGAAPIALPAPAPHRWRGDATDTTVEAGPASETLDERHLLRSPVGTQPTLDRSSQCGITPPTPECSHSPSIIK